MLKYLDEKSELLLSLRIFFTVLVPETVTVTKENLKLMKTTRPPLWSILNRRIKDKRIQIGDELGLQIEKEVNDSKDFPLLYHAHELNNKTISTNTRTLDFKVLELKIIDEFLSEPDIDQPLFEDYKSILIKYEDWLLSFGAEIQDQPVIKKPSIMGYVIMHIYWRKHSARGNLISQVDFQDAGKRYKVSWKHLRNEYNKHMTANTDQFLLFSGEKKHVSCKNQVDRYESFLPLLEEYCKPAYSEAYEDLIKLKALLKYYTENK